MSEVIFALALVGLLLGLLVWLWPVIEIGLLEVIDALSGVGRL